MASLRRGASGCQLMPAILASVSNTCIQILLHAAGQLEKKVYPVTSIAGRTDSFVWHTQVLAVVVVQLSCSAVRVSLIVAG